MHVLFSLLAPLRPARNFTYLHNATPNRRMQRQICRTAWRTQVSKFERDKFLIPTDTQETGVCVQGHFEDPCYTVGGLTTSHSLRP